MKKIWSIIAVGILLAAGMLPAAGAQQPVPFASGGIGVAEQEALRARETEFNLKLVFTLVEGNYVADVRVQVKDEKGAVVVDHLVRGPFFLARLPAGSYSVSAAYRGKRQIREMRIGERLHTEYLRWPSDPQTDFPLKETREAAVREPAPQLSAAVPVNYVSGGIGVSGQDALRVREGEFNLKLVFTLVEGNYIADVRVVIRDAKGGVVIDHVADGPIFLARLPAGSYTVEASYRDAMSSRKVAVGGRLRTEYLRWPSDPQTDFPLPAEKDR